MKCLFQELWISLMFTSESTWVHRRIAAFEVSEELTGFVTHVGS